MKVCLEQNLLNQGRLPRSAFNGGRSGTVKVTQSCLTLCDLWTIPSAWNSPGQNTGVGSLSLLKGIFQARDRTQVSFIAGGLFTSWATQRCSYFLPHTSVHTWTSALRCLILWRWCEECPDFPNKLGKGVNQNQHRVKGGLSGSA